MTIHTNLKQLDHKTLINTIEDATPIEMIIKNNTDQNAKLDKITSWYQTHGLKTYKQKQRKLVYLLGKYNFSGKTLEHIDFYKTQNIWGFSYEAHPFFVYYNEDGLSIEATDECIPCLDEILDILVISLTEME